MRVLGISLIVLFDYQCCNRIVIELTVYSYMYEIADMLMFDQWWSSLLAEEMVGSYF